VRHGILLAQKGALYAARREFTTAVKLIAQANDVEHGTRQYTRAAIAGFQALKEANDLLAPAETLGDLSVAAIVGGHKTKVLDEVEMEDMPPSVAAGYYYDYAREQLATAIGRQTVGSIALYGLGKIIVIGAGASAQQLEFTGPAMALYQASLAAEPDNYRAAHELGVLLAGAGQLEMARELLAQSASRAAQPMIYRNLATVHSRMGDRQSAAQAQQQAEALTKASPDPKTPAVEWVDPAAFAASSTPGSLAPPVVAPAPGAGTMPAANASAKHARPQAEAAAQPSQAFPTSATATPPAPPASELPEANVARKRYSEWNPLNLRR
jgi:tetratricopeptide (TPR) repeat protein